MFESRPVSRKNFIISGKVRVTRLTRVAHMHESQHLCQKIFSEVSEKILSEVSERYMDTSGSYVHWGSYAA